MENINTNLIEEKKKEVEALYGELTSLSRKNVEFTIKLGELFIDLKKLIRGKFTEYVKTLPNMSPRYAQKYMEVARYKVAVKGSAYNCSPFYMAYKIAKIASSYESEQKYLEAEKKHIKEKTPKDETLPASLPPKKEKEGDKKSKPPKKDKPGKGFQPVPPHHSSEDTTNSSFTVIIRGNADYYNPFFTFNLADLNNSTLDNQILSAIQTALSDIKTTVVVSSNAADAPESAEVNSEGDVA